jgi:hypothetical protein
MTNTPITTPPAKRSLLKRLLPYGATAIVALLLGTGIGAAGGSDSAAAPQPTKTIEVEVEKIVEVEVEVPAEADATCAAVAEELQSMLSDTTDQVVIPQNEVMAVLIENLQYGIDIDQINGATEDIGQITASTEALTARIAALSPEFTRCVNP